MSRSIDIVDLLDSGIKAEGLRQRAICSNVANIETPGYRRLDVRFEQLLAKALKSGRQTNLYDIPPELYEPANTPIRSNGNDVNMEAEIGEMVKNSLRQTAYVRLMQKKLAQIERAVDIR